MIESISFSEASQLAALERTIEAARKTFVDAGVALIEIRDNRLYRSKHESFEDYCRIVWGWEKRYAQYVIASAETVKALPEAKRTIVHTETQARELSKVEPAKRVEVLEAASTKAESENRPLRAKDIAEAAKEEKPATLEQQWKDALPKSMQPERSKIQEFIHDEHVRREEAIASLDATELGQLKLEKEVSARMFKDAIKSKLSA